VEKINLSSMSFISRGKLYVSSVQHTDLVKIAHFDKVTYRHNSRVREKSWLTPDSKGISPISPEGFGVRHEAALVVGVEGRFRRLAAALKALDA